MTEPEERNNEIISYNENLYNETERLRPQLVMRDCPKIKEAENITLMALTRRKYWRASKLVEETKPLAVMDSPWTSLNTVGRSSSMI